MTEDKDTDQTELWGAMFDAVKTHSSGSTGEVSEITEAVTAVARAESTKDRAQIANDLRTRADAVQDGPDVMKRRIFNALKDGAGARTLATVAYRVVADLIESDRARDEAAAERARADREAVIDRFRVVVTERDAFKAAIEAFLIGNAERLRTGDTDADLADLAEGYWKLTGWTALGGDRS